MKIPEEKVKQFTELLDGLTDMQFNLLCQQASVFYSGHKQNVKLTTNDLRLIEDNCRREFI